MKKFLKIFFISIGILILLTIIAGFIIGYFYNDKVTGYFIKELNKSIDVKISVKKVDLSIFSKFPDASIEFSDVFAEPNKKFIKKDFKNYSDTLISAKKIYLSFNILDIFDDKYNIKKVEIQNGKANILIDKNGNENFVFWKTSNDSTSENNIQINLNNITLKNFDLLIKNLQNNFTADFAVNKLNLNGEFKNDDFTMKTVTDAYVREFIIDKIKYINQKQISLNTKLDVNNGKIYKIKNGQLFISDLEFNVNGNINLTEAKTIDLKIDGANLNIESFLSVLPENYRKKAENFDSEGKFYFNVTINGKINNDNIPHIEADFGINKGTIEQIKSDVKFTDVNFTGKYTNGEQNNLKTTFFKISDFTGFLEKNKIQGKFLIENFDNPKMQFSVDAGFDLMVLNNFINIDTIQDISGDLQLKVKFFGKIKDINNITSDDFKNAKSQGNITINNTNLKFINSNVNYSNICGKMFFRNNSLKIDSLKLNIDKNDFYITGEFNNFINFVLFDNQKTDITGTLQCNNIDINNLLENFKTNNNGEPSDSAINIFPQNINLRLRTNIKNFKYDNFVATDLTTYLSYKNNNFTFNDLSFDAMQGNVSGAGRLKKIDNNTINLKTSIFLNNITADKLFYSFNNFGQDYLSDKNLKGKITADIDFSSDMDNNLNINEDKITSTSKIQIKNGELKDFKPIESLAKFIELSELRDIKFSNLKNDILIKNKKIIIPEMKIKSSAFDIDFSGEHTFNNQMNYHLKVLLSDILSKKARKAKSQNKEFGVIEDDGLGKTSLFLSIKGNADDYKIAYDTKKVKEHIKQSLSNEKSNLKQILNNEFGLFKNDSIVKQNKKKIKENSSSTNFTISWDDDDTTGEEW